jgi:hypothetical protein
MAAELALALLTVAWLAGGWLVLGWWLLRRVPALLPSERLALALLAGAGVMGVALFVVGQLWFTRAMVLALGALAWLPLAAGAHRRELRDAARAIRSPGAAVLALMVPLLGLIFAAGLARPIGDIGADGVSYHLLGPATWLRQHRVVPVMDASTTAFPVAVESLFGAAMAIGNDRGPGLIGAVLLLAVVVQLHGVARWLGAGERWAPLASVLFAFMPPMTSLTTHAFVDVEYAGFALAACRLMFADGTDRSLVGPLFLGLSMATKYNGLTLAVITLALAALRSGRLHGAAAALRLAARGAAIGALLALPFLLRNLIVLGTPIYPPPPALARWLPGKGFSLAASVDLKAYIMEQRGSGLGRGLRAFLLLPWRFTYQTANFHGAGGIGLAPLAFLPAALAARWTATVGWCLAWMAANTAVWFVVQQEARFLAPFVAVATVLAVMGAEALVRTFRRAGRAAVAVVLAISLGYGGAILATTLVPEARSAFSRRAEENRWRAGVRFHQAFAYLNALPDPCRVLILSWSVAPFFLHKDYLKIEGLYHEHPVPGVEDAQAALARLRLLGVTHVLDVRPPEPRGPSFVVPVPPPPPLRLVFESDDARVFAVR